MRIQIDVTDRDPPAGRLLLDGGRAIDFAGWLGLMGALSEALADDSERADHPQAGGTTARRRP